jgi:hypothetical protein
MFRPMDTCCECSDILTSMSDVETQSGKMRGSGCFIGVASHIEYCSSFL